MGGVLDDRRSGRGGRGPQRGDVGRRPAVMDGNDRPRAGGDAGRRVGGIDRQIVFTAFGEDGNAAGGQDGLDGGHVGQGGDDDFETADLRGLQGKVQGRGARLDGHAAGRSGPNGQGLLETPGQRALSKPARGQHGFDRGFFFRPQARAGQGDIHVQAPRGAVLHSTGAVIRGFVARRADLAVDGKNQQAQGGDAQAGQRFLGPVEKPVDQDPDLDRQEDEGNDGVTQRPIGPRQVRALAAACTMTPRTVMKVKRFRVKPTKTMTCSNVEVRI